MIELIPRMSYKNEITLAVLLCAVVGFWSCQERHQKNSAPGILYEKTHSDLAPPTSALVATEIESIGLMKRVLITSIDSSNFQKIQWTYSDKVYCEEWLTPMRDAIIHLDSLDTAIEILNEIEAKILDDSTFTIHSPWVPIEFLRIRCNCSLRWQGKPNKFTYSDVGESLRLRVQIDDGTGAMLEDSIFIDVTR